MRSVARPGRNDLALAAYQAEIRRSTASSISQQRVRRVETLQSEPIASGRAGRAQRPERVLPAPPLARGTGSSATSIWSSWQAHSGCALATTPSSRNRGTSSGWMTWMCAMCGRVSDGPFARRAASTASSALADRPVADRVEVGLEPERVEARRRSRRGRRGRLELSPRLSVGRPWPSRYGSSIAPVKFSRTPSMHDLHAGRRVAADRRRRAVARRAPRSARRRGGAPTTARRRPAPSARRAPRAPT